MAYTPDITKFGDGGLNLNLPVDLIPKAQYSRLTNAVSKVEGTLQQRDGVTKICVVDTDQLPTSAANSIFRLVQRMPGTSSERLVATGDGDLWSLIDPPGNSPFQLTGLIYDGKPLSFLSFLFTNDPIPWAIIANGAGMRKHRPGYYQNLGLAAPTVQASFSAAVGTGTLNSSGGIPYDWRYTYVNGITLSESNPSPIAVTLPSNTSAPTAFTNPDPTLGGNQFANPANAFDGNPATFASGSAPAPVSDGEVTASCQWNTWSGGNSSPGVSFPLTIIANMTISGSGGGSGSGTISYSTDNGNSWFTAAFNQSGTFVITLPSSTVPSNILVRASVHGFRVTIDIPGHPNKILTGSASMQVFEMSTGIASSGGVPVTLALTNQSANVCVTPPTDPQDTLIGLYREGGSLPAGVWFFVGYFPISSLSQGTCGTGTLQINDNVPDVQIEGSPVLAFDNDAPVSSVQATNVPLPVIWGPYPESTPMVLGTGDPARPNAVYFSKEGNADEWPPQNWVLVGSSNEPVVSGTIYGTRCYVFTTEGIYMLLANIVPGVTFSPFETDAKHGLFSRWGLCVGAKGMYFISKDGIYVSQGGPEQSIVEEALRPLFPKQDAPQGVDTNGYFAPDYTQPDAMRLQYHNGEIWFGYVGITDQNIHWLIFDEIKMRWRAAVHTPEMATVYSEPSVQSSLLLGGTDGALYAGGGTTDNGTGIPVVIRTGAFDQGVPLKVKEYGNALFDIDPGGATITITPYINGDTVANVPITITGTGRQEAPLPLGDVLARNVSFDIEWSGGTPILYQLTIMYRPSATAMTHWELPPTSHGLSGVQHVRDAYISIRTNAPVTFTVTADITGPMVFTIPNTSNQKQKIYIPFLANKGRLYKYQFDSTAVFQLYASETELRCKSWNTVMGYQIAPILGAELPAAVTES